MRIKRVGWSSLRGRLPFSFSACHLVHEPVRVEFKRGADWINCAGRSNQRTSDVSTRISLITRTYAIFAHDLSITFAGSLYAPDLRDCTRTTTRSQLIQPYSNMVPTNPRTSSLPSMSTLTTALSHPLLTSTNLPVTLSSILPSRKTTRVLLIFIRHFFCGNCQQYLYTLTASLPPDSLPDDLSIVVIGCGAPSLIESYVEITQCPWPVYTDPTSKLYEVLGMQRSLSLGSRNPGYIQHSLVVGALKSMMQGLKRIPTGDIWEAGDMSVNGGEFLFVRESVMGEESLADAETAWRVRWCHRMRNTRDHTEVDHLKTVLGLNPPRVLGSGTLNEKEAARPPMMRRSTTSKLHRAMSKRSQSLVQSLTRTHTMRSGGLDSRPQARRFHSHSASVQMVSAS